MGLFDKGTKKGRDDFDSPVEEVNLARPAQPAQPQAQAQSGAAPARDAERDFHYGINRAIELMRLLPSDNIELVVKVVKTTLESTQVKVATIIDDASRKQDDIERRISGRKKEIADLEVEIAHRKKEIEGLEADHAETTMVKERLVLAEKLSSRAATDAPVAVPPVRQSVPITIPPAPPQPTVVIGGPPISPAAASHRK